MGLYWLNPYLQNLTSSQGNPSTLPCKSVKFDNSPSYSRYMEASEAMVDMLRTTPLHQRYSIDEVFLDYSNMRKCYMEVAHEIRERIHKELGFTVNIGISHTSSWLKLHQILKSPTWCIPSFPMRFGKKCGPYLWKIYLWWVLGPKN